jgi:DNA polymerase III subunit alpha
MSFVHLHIHTEWSLLRGMARIKHIVEKAKSLGFTSLAITDYGAMYGVFKFYLACKDAGIKPIIGCDLYKAEKSRLDKQPNFQSDAYSLIAIAKNTQGYKNLIKIVSLASLEGNHYKPRVDFELLERYHEGLTIISGSPNKSELGIYLQKGEFTKAKNYTKKMQNIFGNDYYISLERHHKQDKLEELNQLLLKHARSFGVPVVASANVHYVNQDDSYAHEVLLCIGSQRVIYETDRPESMMEVPDYYFKTSDEMATLFADLPEAIENTQKIANECDVEIPFGHLILPKYPLPAGQNDVSHLDELVLNRKGRVASYDQKQVDERIKYELGIINDKGYAPYFLFIQDVVNWAKNEGIAVGPGRGSAAGSLVAYILRITDINPLDYNLPFERFLNPERPTPPDIDIDFADTRREEVVKYIATRYGEDKVAQIITFGTMEARMVVRDVGRALGHSYATGDRIAKMIPLGKQGAHTSLDSAMSQTPELKLAYDNEEEIQQIIDISKKLESLPRHVSVHAAGLIVADRDITDHIPVQREPKGDKIITQYDMYSLDLNAVSENKAIGLVKADILGLRNLSIIESALNLVQKIKGKKIDIHEILLDDTKTYDLISSGRTVGVFQLESGGMRRLARELRPNKLSDITAMVALYRPGPMDLIPTFIEGKKNPKSVQYPHKDLKSVLEETYGILVYQEQVIDIAVVMAHFTKSQADLLRMAVGKKKKSLMEKGKIQFIKGCISHGYTEKLAHDIFGFIEKFASYGFNKSHAASYALIAYWTAFIKANHTIEYMTSLLTAEMTSATGPQREVKMAMVLEECGALGIPVLPPDITKSNSEFSIEGNSIRFGLSAIKNIGSAAIESITSSRATHNFVSFNDFVNRVDLRRVNKKSIESLIKVGAFAKFGTRASLLQAYPDILSKIQKHKEERQNGQGDLFGTLDRTSDKDDLPDVAEMSSDLICEYERELIGFLLTQDPLTRHKEIIKQKTTHQIGTIDDALINKSVIVAGLISQLKIVMTRKDNLPMAMLMLSEGNSKIQAVVFPKTYEKVREYLKIHSVLLAKGKISKREEELTLLIENCVNLDMRKTVV